MPAEFTVLRKGFVFALPHARSPGWEETYGSHGDPHRRYQVRWTVPGGIECFCAHRVSSEHGSVARAFDIPGQTCLTAASASSRCPIPREQKEYHGFGPYVHLPPVSSVPIYNTNV